MAACRLVKADHHQFRVLHGRTETETPVFVTLSGWKGREGKVTQPPSLDAWTDDVEYSDPKGSLALSSTPPTPFFPSGSGSGRRAPIPLGSGAPLRPPHGQSPFGAMPVSQC